MLPLTNLNRNCLLLINLWILFAILTFIITSNCFSFLKIVSIKKEWNPTHLNNLNFNHFWKRVIPDLNLPAEEQTSSSHNSNEHHEKCKSSEVIAAEEKLRLKRYRQNIASQKYQSKFNKESVKKAKENLKGDELKHYLARYKIVMQARNFATKKQNAKRRERTKRLREGKGTEADHEWKRKDSLKNKKSYKKMMKIIKNGQS